MSLRCHSISLVLGSATVFQQWKTGKQGVKRPIDCSPLLQEDQHLLSTVRERPPFSFRLSQWFESKLLHFQRVTHYFVRDSDANLPLPYTNLPRLDHDQRLLRDFTRSWIFVESALNVYENEPDPYTNPVSTCATILKDWEPLRTFRVRIKGSYKKSSQDRPKLAALAFF